MTRYWITGAAGDWSVAGDWQSGIAPTAADDAVINNSSAVTVNGSAVAHSLALNNSTLTVSGSLTIVTTLTVDGSGYLRLSGGTVSAQSITSGTSTFGTVYGHGIVNGPISDNVSVEANGGTLSLLGSISNDYSLFTIDSGATLELGSDLTAPISFAPNATLKLDTPSAFAAPIGNLGVTDTIDLVGITASSATYSGTTLTINETNGQQLTYSIGGSIAGNTVKVASDNHGGTLVSWVPPAESWITGAAGDWSVAGDWQSGVAPTATDDAVINNSNAVTANGSSVVGQPTPGSAIEVRGTGDAGDTLTLYADGGTASVGTGTVAVSGSFDITTSTTFAGGIAHANRHGNGRPRSHQRCISELCRDSRSHRTVNHAAWHDSQCSSQRAAQQCDGGDVHREPSAECIHADDWSGHVCGRPRS